MQPRVVRPSLLRPPRGHLVTNREVNVIVPGAILGFVSWLLFNVIANWYWPLLGLEIQGVR